MAQRTDPAPGTRYDPLMCWRSLVAYLMFAVAMGGPQSFAATKPQTVCTITVNSADEKDMFRRHLPAAKYRFVELVEPGRPDWLASACREQVSCDTLIISGHYDGGNEFFSDQLEAREFLPVAELERVSCSDSCPGLFSQLKEVYLFGCNTLNPSPQSSATVEVVRSLVREGRSPQQTERHLQASSAAHGESSLERMRQIFKDVPVIYGFSSVAPLGPVAASALGRYFAATGAREIGEGRANSRLLGYFAPFSLAMARGMTDDDPHAGVRRDMCRFADDRLSDANKLGFIHELLQRPTADAWMYIDRIQRQATALADPARRTPEVARVLDEIAHDTAARARLLGQASRVEQAAVRTRVLNVARDLGWLSEDERWAELALMLADLQARKVVGTDEVNLACTLNQDHDLEGAFNRRVVPGSSENDATHTAMRACLGSTEAHLRMLDALVSSNEADVQVARTYLRHRPLTDTTELRRVAEGIAGMPASEAQVHALEALGRHYLSDRDILDRLVRLFSETSSWSVQAAIAGILVRADRASIASQQLLATLQGQRRPSPPGDNMIDALVHRLQSP